MNLQDSGVEAETLFEPLMYRAVLQTPLPVEVVAEAPVQSDTVADVELSLREAHERGRREALIAAEADFQQKLAGERALLSRVVQQFEQEKKKYFSEVEGEVVKLSLAIAERVLHREAEMDPTLLAGAARVALEQVQDTSEAVLRVSSEDTHQWSETLGSAGKSVQVEACDQLGKGEAVLKTRSGSVQLGIKAQLQEIERGFFELLTRRPMTAAAAL